ncbi:uncharacterized protein V1518DRAFT_420735 [Limtongia smithiae]|uniref:uncharacterized protein n=1 Tax=Limtongia smithiae TaxID=1125753 RepID=UPI0034CF0328
MHTPSNKTPRRSTATPATGVRAASALPRSASHTAIWASATTTTSTPQRSPAKPAPGTATARRSASSRDLTGVLRRRELNLPHLPPAPDPDIASSPFVKYPSPTPATPVAIPTSVPIPADSPNSPRTAALTILDTPTTALSPPPSPSHSPSSPPAVAALRAQLAGKDAELASLRASIAQHATRRRVELERVAEELHRQYAAKHEAKVRALREHLHARYAAKLRVLEVELAAQREQNSELVRCWDQLLEAEEAMQ